jgi:leader peptidase (prepilin peptidase)/N-methyltransferase
VSIVFGSTVIGDRHLGGLCEILECHTSRSGLRFPDLRRNAGGHLGDRSRATPTRHSGNGGGGGGDHRDIDVWGDPGSWTETTAWVVVGVVLSGQVHIDLAVQRLPRQISHVGLVVVVALLLASPAPSNGGPVGMLVGTVSMWVITAGLIAVSRHKLGRGDLHLSPLLGAVIGWFDPWGLLTAWLVTAVAGGAVAAVLLATGRVERDTVIPYGPFMVLGTVGAWMWVPV